MNKRFPLEFNDWRDWTDPDLVRYISVDNQIWTIRLPCQHYTGVVTFSAYKVYYINGVWCDQQLWEEHENMQLFNEKIEALIDE